MQKKQKTTSSTTTYEESSSEKRGTPRKSRYNEILRARHASQQLKTKDVNQSLSFLFGISIILKLISACLSLAFESIWILGFWVPLSIFIFYIIIGWFLVRKEKLSEIFKFGDSCYYIGFLFTIASIVIVLWDLGVSNFEAQGVAVRFSIAMVTTLIGMLIRVAITTFGEGYFKRRTYKETVIKSEITKEENHIYTESFDFSESNAKNKVGNNGEHLKTDVQEQILTTIKESEDPEFIEELKTIYSVQTDEELAENLYNTFCGRSDKETAQKVKDTITNSDTKTARSLEAISQGYDYGLEEKIAKILEEHYEPEVTDELHKALGTTTDEELAAKLTDVALGRATDEEVKKVQDILSNEESEIAEDLRQVLSGLDPSIKEKVFEAIKKADENVTSDILKVVEQEENQEYKEKVEQTLRVKSSEANEEIAKATEEDQEKQDAIKKALEENIEFITKKKLLENAAVKTNAELVTETSKAFTDESDELKDHGLDRILNEDKSVLAQELKEILEANKAVKKQEEFEEQTDYVQKSQEKGAETGTFSQETYSETPKNNTYGGSSSVNHTFDPVNVTVDDQMSVIIETNCRLLGSLNEVLSETIDKFDLLRSNVIEVCTRTQLDLEQTSNFMAEAAEQVAKTTKESAEQISANQKQLSEDFIRINQENQENLISGLKEGFTEVVNNMKDSLEKNFTNSLKAIQTEARENFRTSHEGIKNITTLALDNISSSTEKLAVKIKNATNDLTDSTASLNSSLKDVGNGLKEMNNDLSTSQTNIKQMNANLGDIVNTNKEFVLSQKAFSAEIKSLAEPVANLKNELGSLTINNEVDALKEQINNLTSEIERLKKNLKK